MLLRVPAVVGVVEKVSVAAKLPRPSTARRQIGEISLDPEDDAAPLPIVSALEPAAEIGMAAANTRRPWRERLRVRKRGERCTEKTRCIRHEAEVECAGIGRRKPRAVAAAAAPGRRPSVEPPPVVDLGVVDLGMCGRAQRRERRRAQCSRGQQFLFHNRQGFYDACPSGKLMGRRGTHKRPLQIVEGCVFWATRQRLEPNAQEGVREMHLIPSLWAHD